MAYWIEWIVRADDAANIVHGMTRKKKISKSVVYLSVNVTIIICKYILFRAIHILKNDDNYRLKDYYDERIMFCAAVFLNESVFPIKGCPSIVYCYTVIVQLRSNFFIFSSAPILLSSVFVNGCTSPSSRTPIPCVLLFNLRFLAYA